MRPTVERDVTWSWALPTQQDGGGAGPVPDLRGVVDAERGDVVTIRPFTATAAWYRRDSTGETTARVSVTGRVVDASGVWTWRQVTADFRAESEGGPEQVVRVAVLARLPVWLRELVAAELGTPEQFRP